MRSLGMWGNDEESVDVSNHMNNVDEEDYDIDELFKHCLQLSVN